MSLKDSNEGETKPEKDAAPETGPSAEAAKEGMEGTKAAAAAKTKAEIKAEARAKAKALAKALAEALAEATPEPEPETETEPEAAPEPEPEPEPQPEREAALEEGREAEPAVKPGAKSLLESPSKSLGKAKSAATSRTKAIAKSMPAAAAPVGKRSTGALLSLVMAMLLGMMLTGGMVALWQMFGDGKELPPFALFLAQFHPIFVHLPISLLVVVFLMEVLSIFPIWRNLTQNTLFLLWLAALGSGAAIVAGYLLKASGEYAGPRVESHMWLGLTVAVGSWAVLTLKSAGAAGSVYRVILALTVVVLVLAGHLGGTITHGPDYLVKHMPEPYRSWPMFDDGRFLSLFGAISGSGQGKATGRLYDDYVARVLAEKCTKCHGEDKQKGKLRLDSHDFILKGAEGSDFLNVVIGRPEESEMLVRAHLPVDDDDHMPPDGEPQLTAEEVELLEWWIGKGKASADLKVADIAIDMELAGILKKLGPAEVVEKKDAVETASGETEVVKPVSSERELALKEIRAKGFSIRTVSAEDDGLLFNAVNAADEFDDGALAFFEPVAGSFVELRLGKTKITDKSGPLLGKMRSLVTLHLENTAITDAAVAEMTELDNLEYLNLYGTKVTDEVVEDLLKLDGLKTVYLWQTGVTAEGAAKLRSGKAGLTVDMGWAEKSAEKKTAE